MNDTKEQQIFVWMRFKALLVCLGLRRLPIEIVNCLIIFALSSFWQKFQFSEVKPLEGWPIWAGLSGSWLTRPRVAGILVLGTSQRARALDRPERGWAGIPIPENGYWIIKIEREKKMEMNYQAWVRKQPEPSCHVVACDKTGAVNKRIK